MRAETGNSEMSKGVSVPAGTSKSWNWHPDLPIQYSPIFSFPTKPLAILRWIASAWLPLTELTCYLLLAIAIWFLVQPSLQDTTTLASGWIAKIMKTPIVKKLIVMQFTLLSVFLRQHNYQ